MVKTLLPKPDAKIATPFAPFHLVCHSGLDHAGGLTDWKHGHRGRHADAQGAEGEEHQCGYDCVEVDSGLMDEISFPHIARQRGDEEEEEDDVDERGLGVEVRAFGDLGVEASRCVLHQEAQDGVAEGAGEKGGEHEEHFLL